MRLDHDIHARVEDIQRQALSVGSLPLVAIGRLPTGDLVVHPVGPLSPAALADLFRRCADLLESSSVVPLPDRAHIGMRGPGLLRWINRQPDPQAARRRVISLGRARRYPAWIRHWDEDQVADVLHEIQSKPERGKSPWGGRKLADRGQVESTDAEDSAN